MADDEWQLEAVHEQFNVFETLTTPFKKFHSFDIQGLMMEVADIKNFHLKMDKPYTNNPRVISSEIIKHPDGSHIKLSFVVIVTNIESNNRLCKMPIFVLTCGGKKKYIDMNLTLFSSWKAFLSNNDLPPCQFCFPVDGEYSVGGKLKIDFASSSIAVRENVGLMWRSLGFVVAVGLVVGSFFFTIPEFKHSKADSLVKIAQDFVPGLKKYARLILTGVTIIQKIKYGNQSALEGLSDLWKLMTQINDEFNEEISWVFDKVRTASRKFYTWLKDMLNYLLSLFRRASKWAQDNFLAVVWRVDGEITAVETEAEEILQASQSNNYLIQADQVAAAIHANGTSDSGREYADAIFKNAKVDSALHKGMEKNDDSSLNTKTLDLLEISSLLADKLGKTSLQDVQDTFEVIFSTVKDEFKHKMDNYTKMLSAAKAASGRTFDPELFNQALGIKGSPTEYYWQESISSVLEDRQVNRINGGIEKLTKEKKVLILPISKLNEGSTEGLYRLRGIHGAGMLTSNELIQALRENLFDLGEDLVVNATKSMIMIRAEELTFTAKAELNSNENTSEGFLLVVKNEVV